MPPQRLTQNEVAEILRPHYDRLWRCGALPFYKYLEQYPNTAIHNLRTRANIVHDLMVHQARLEFGEVRNARIIDLQHPYLRTFVEINERILLRFKKLDETKHAKNYPTKFVRDYEQDRDLPGIPPRAHRLTLGYRLNLLQTEVLDVLITSFLGKRLEFDLEFYLPHHKVISIADAEATFAQVKPQRRLVRVKVMGQQTLRDE